MHRRTLLAGALALPALAARAATTVRLSHGFGIHYLPLMVIRDRHLLEQHAQAAGLGPVTTEWRVLDGGNVINDAMLSGALDIAGTGAPGFITLWAKAHAMPSSAVTGVCALGNGALWLNTNNPAIHSLRDFSSKDKIAVPGIKTSFAAVVLQMAAAHEFGIDQYAKLDPLTVSLPHPEAMAALISGKTEIDAHFASPPFSNQELTYPNIHRVVSTSDLLGPITIDVVYASERFAAANRPLMAAFLAAKDDADHLIAADPATAADIYARMSGVKLAPDLIRTMLTDKETSFTVAPAGVMKYADFLARTGTIRTAPTTWSDLFIPDLAHYPGS